MSLGAGTALGPYDITALLGAGGMGEVYRATDRRLGRSVALKVLPADVAGDPDRRRLFEQEARAASALNHPHICALFDIGSSGGHDFLVMEYLEGETLAERLTRGPLPLAQALQVGIETADALDKAHRRGIVHRDLKPGNLMLTAGGVKLLDFGLATLAPVGTEEERSRQATHEEPVGARLVGTPYYMAPEQARGEAADHRSDVFAFGVVLYEMVTGRRPFEGGNLVTVLGAVLHDTPVPATRLDTRLPMRLGRIIDHCLAKEPSRRWQAMGDVRDRLETLRADVDSAVRVLDRSIAVLPFADLSPEGDQAYLCEGIAEEILTALSKVRGLRVASRPAAFRSRLAQDDMADIGTRLQVSTLLDGSVRKADGRLRITVKLVDVNDGFCLWSDRYDREMRDVFAIQDEIARAVVAAMQMTLSAADHEALAKVATSDVDAYVCYLRGRSYFFNYGRRGIAFARELFERAIEIDPAYARAFAGLSDCYAYLYLYVGRDRANLEGAIAAASRALDLEPQLAEAHASLGMALSLASRHAEAESAFRAAILLNPYLFEAHYFYARDSFAQGKIDQAIQQYEDASRVRPEDYQSPLLVAQLYDDLGHPDAARASRLHGIAIAEEHLKLNPDDARALYMGANGLVAVNDIAKGLAWAARAAAMDPDDPMLLYNVACIYSMADRGEAALDCLERAVTAGLTQREWLAHDSNLDRIRQTPRFEALMARLA